MNPGQTYPHEGCPGCVFLGPFGDESVLVGDLWFCDQGGNLPTVILKYDEPQDAYESGIGRQEPWAHEARKRAIRRGLLPEPTSESDDTTEGQT